MDKDFRVRAFLYIENEGVAAGLYDHVLDRVDRIAQARLVAEFICRLKGKSGSVRICHDKYPSRVA